MITKFAESTDINGFTLSVRDMGGNVDVDKNYDTQYLAIGK